MVPFAPWRLMITLGGEDLSTSGLRAALPKATGNEVEALLAERDPYDLQLEHDAEHLPAPVLRARLVRRVRTTAGWDLAFAFESSDIALLSLVHELSGRA
jgi:hypothetical protein